MWIWSRLYSRIERGEPMGREGAELGWERWVGLGYAYT
jgi:hypothetical protein